MIEMANAKRVLSDRFTADLFVEFPVTNFTASLAWYNQLFGCTPAFYPNEIEAVWELAEHRYLYIKLNPEHAGHASCLVFLGDLDGFVNQVNGRKLKPSNGETLANGVRKLIYADPDGNEVCFGGSPLK